MKLYSDKNLKTQIETLDLGIVAAGESATFTYYVQNDTLADVRDLVFKIDSAEVKIKKAPKDLLPKASAELVIEWSPSVTLKQGLSTRLQVSGIELWS